MREGRRLRLHLHRRMRQSRDAVAACVRGDTVGVCADGGRLSQGDDASLSASATTCVWFVPFGFESWQEFAAECYGGHDQLEGVTCASIGPRAGAR
jgi:hypothetical protein